TGHDGDSLTARRGARVDPEGRPMAKFAMILGAAAMLGGVALGDEGGWSAGAARADITPKGPVWMAGYAARKAPSEGVAHPLSAKALALRDGRGRTLLWITADLIGFDRELTERVARRLGEAHALPREAIALFASHTHCGPLVKYVPE